MSFWSKLFGKDKVQSGHRDEEYKVITVSVGDLDQYSDGIGDIRKRAIDGFLIKGVFNSDEIATLVKNYDAFSPEGRIEVNPGMITYPAPFSVVDKTAEKSSNSLKTYHKESAQFWEQFPEKYGVDFVKKVTNTLNQISGSRVVQAPSGIDGEGSYNPATFKHLVPGQGEFKAHCGNYFHAEFPSFYEHMKEISDIEHQMSYFVMLSPAHVGGELTMYEVEWSEAEIREPGDTTLVTKSGERLDLTDPNSVGRKTIVPEPGDMFVFAGGQIWHKVEVVTGTKPRYTMGGFMTISKADDTLYIWS